MFRLCRYKPERQEKQRLLFCVEYQDFDKVCVTLHSKLGKSELNYTGHVIIDSNIGTKTNQYWLVNGKLHNVKSAAFISTVRYQSNPSYWINGNYLAAGNDYPLDKLTNDNHCVLDFVRDKVYEDLIWYTVLTKDKIYDAVPNIPDFWERLPPIDI